MDERTTCKIFRGFSAIHPDVCVCGKKEADHETTPFTNPRYEYATREYPTTRPSISGGVDDEMNKHGWSRVWADVTQEGTFVVYRRERTREVSTEEELRQARAERVPHVAVPGSEAAQILAGR